MMHGTINIKYQLVVTSFTTDVCIRQATRFLVDVAVLFLKQTA